MPNLDGRVKAAKKYTFIIQPDDLINDVLPDWTGFIPSHQDIMMTSVKNEVDEFQPDQILIVELKKGGFPIGFTEIAQAENYIRQIKKSGCLHKAATIFRLRAKLKEHYGSLGQESIVEKALNADKQIKMQ